MRELQVFESPIVLADHFSDQLMKWIAIADGERFDLAISGGTTPNLLFSALADKYADSPLWEKTHFWWVDERMVSWEDPESNYGTSRRLLFSKIALPNENIHPINGVKEPVNEAISYQQQISRCLKMRSGWPVFDLILLGMGEDGHTASIFPNQLDLLYSERFCEVAVHPLSHQKRITLTGNVINHAESICFMVTGANKNEPLRNIWIENAKGKLLPAGRIMPEQGQLTWFCDAAAAEGLPNLSTESR